MDTRAAFNLLRTVAIQFGTCRSGRNGERDWKDPASKDAALGALQSFLLGFASRSASRERLHVFTTNYDRLIEHGCDESGQRAARHAL